MKQAFQALGVMSLMAFSASTLAINLSVYQQPNTSAKVVEHMKQTAHLLPFYSNDKQQDWIKVANRKTGQVGWVQKQALAKAYQQESKAALKQFHFANTQQHQPQWHTERFVITSKPGKEKGSSVIEYSGTSKLDKKQVEALIARMQARQQRMQNDMHIVFGDMMQDFQQPFFDAPSAVIVVPTPMQPQQNSQTILVPHSDVKTSTDSAKEKQSLNWYHRIKNYITK